MKSVRVYWLTMLFVVLTFAAPIVVYDRLPAQVPIHWNTDGAIDQWASRPIGAFFLPCLAVLVVALLVVSPRLSPRGFEMVGFERYQPALVAAVAGTLSYVELLILRSSLGARLPIGPHVLVLVGAVFMVAGNYFGKTARNFFFGIRTPWTLARDEIWERTHRLGGRLWVLCGLAIVAIGLNGRGFGIGPLIVVGVAVVVPTAYSYLLWRRLEGPPNPDGRVNPPKY